MTIGRRIGTAALIAITALASASSAIAQAAQTDGWKLVPAPATTCFSDDGFADKLAAAQAAINAEIEKQNKINDAARERFDNMDMAEKAQRMQAFMMKNPRAAMKMMQAEQAAGAATAAAVTDADGATKRLLAELPQLHASFRAAVEQAVQPVRAKQAELIKAKTVLVGEVQEPMFANAADHAQYVQLIAEENAAIEQACAPFFGANGTFHKWLTSYRTEVVEKNMSVGDQTDIMIMQMAAMDLPGGGYRSTGPLTQAHGYVHQMSVVYAVRQAKVRPTVGLRK